LKRSAVADNLSGDSQLSDVRTSSGTFISKNKVPFFFLSEFTYLTQSLTIFFHLFIYL